jgi:hypothetical protein
MIFVSLKFSITIYRKMPPKKKQQYRKKGDTDPRKVVGAPIHVSVTLIFSNGAEVGRN